MTSTGGCPYSAPASHQHILRDLSPFGEALLSATQRQALHHLNQGCKDNNPNIHTLSTQSLSL